jgi:hypothetical protein
MADSDNLLDTVASSYANARGFIARANALFALVTFKIARGKPEESIADLDKKFGLDASQQQTLFELAARKGGPAYIDEKIQDMNRAAFHRSAFALNALAQLLLVDLPAQIGLSFFYMKLALVLANAVLALYAHVSLSWTLEDLIAGPDALPPKRRFFGLAVNPRYNKAVKNRSRPYAREAWKEKSLFRPAYFINAATIFFGTQFIVPLERLIFPFGMLFGKIIGLIATAITAFDIWRGVKAGDDARVAREREVSVYRDLNI